MIPAYFIGGSLDLSKRVLREDGSGPPPLVSVPVFPAMIPIEGIKNGRRPQDYIKIEVYRLSMVRRPYDGEDIAIYLYEHTR